MTTTEVTALVTAIAAAVVSVLRELHRNRRRARRRRRSGAPELEREADGAGGEREADDQERDHG